jgi:hypothetical protein
VETVAPVPLHEELYETDESVIPWCDVNWGDEICAQENYSLYLVKALLPHLERIKLERAMDLGCKTGRTSFELAKLFSYVLGLDKVRRFPDGFGFGYRFSAGALASKYSSHGSLVMLDSAAQARFSIKRSIFDLWAGPGIGIGCGVAADSQAEYLPIFPFILPRLSVEAGIRLQVIKNLAIDISWEESSILSVFSIFGTATTQLRFEGAPYLGLAVSY